MTLLLPRATVPAVLAPGMSAPLGEPRPAGRVLVIEDDLAVADVAVGSLERLGYMTVAVDRAAKALELLYRGERFDLIFSDIMMPEMSGMELAEEIARQHPGIPVLLTTGYNNMQTAGQHRDILIKPYSLDTLKRAITRCRAREAGSAPNR